MSLEVLIGLIAGFRLENLAKLVVLTLLVFYFIFAVVVFRQVQIMVKTVETNASFLVRMAALFQVLACFLLLGLGFILL